MTSLAAPARVLRSLAIGVLLVAAATAAWGALRANAAATALAHARRNAMQVSVAWDQHNALLTQVPQSAPSTGSITERLVECLRAAGSGPESLLSLSPEEPIRLDGGALKQRLSLTLEGLTLSQVGAWMEALAQRAPEWTLHRIEIAPLTNRRGAPGENRPLRLIINAESLTAPATSGPLREADESSPGGSL